MNIKQWGNSLGVRLPASVAREARLHVDQRVRVSVEGDQVFITPLDGSAFASNGVWLPTIQSATVASRCPPRRRLEPNGRRQDSVDGCAQALDAG